MNTATQMAVEDDASPPADLRALKDRQQAADASGNDAVAGTKLQIFDEDLREVLDFRLGQKVPNVAAGNGNAPPTAARRWYRAVSADYVSTLLELGMQLSQKA